MRYFDETLINAHPRQHGQWFAEVNADREVFHKTEENLAALSNNSAVLPRDAWLEMDTITRRVMRSDEGRAWMADLMPLAKPVNIGKLVHLNRVSSDAGTVHRSLSGQVPTALDKVQYDYRGTPVPMFDSGYGREWREWNTQRSENFDALADDQEAHTAALKKNMAMYVLDGDDSISVENYKAYGIRNHPLSKSIIASIDLTSQATTADEIDNYFTFILGTLLDDNYISQPVNLYISPEMGRSFDRPYSGATGFKGGKLMDQLLRNRRTGKIAVSFELTGNEFFGFVPNAQYIRPLVGMAVNTIAIPRIMPRANYQFVVSGAMGIDIRADYNERSGVFYSVPA